MYHFSSISWFEVQTVTLTHIFTCMYRQKKRVDKYFMRSSISKIFKTLILTIFIREILILCFPYRSGYWGRTFKKSVPHPKFGESPIEILWRQSRRCHCKQQSVFCASTTQPKVTPTNHHGNGGSITSLSSLFLPSSSR